ncbi:hypothetical protein N8963_02570 [Candidatus Pelagibacter sp.]|nr:hypothetical protein [Candidatus Pelagibacter sp.]
MYNSNSIEEILKSSNVLQRKIDSFKLKQSQKIDFLIIEKNKLDIILDNCFNLAHNLLLFVDDKLKVQKNLIFILKMIKISISKIIDKLLNSNELVLKSKLLEKRMDEHQSFIELSVKENKELKNDINKISSALNKILENPNNILENSENKFSENLGHNSISRVDFYQEENVRLGSELLETKKKFEIMKTEIEKFQNQRSSLIEKINSVNDAIKDSNIVTNVFENKNSQDKIYIKDPQKNIKKNSLNLNSEIEKIFQKK